MSSSSAEDRTYQIKIRGMLDDSWSDWLNGVTMAFEGNPSDGDVTTIMTARLDQAALRGVLNRMWDLNLSVLSVCRV